MLALEQKMPYINRDGREDLDLVVDSALKTLKRRSGPSFEGSLGDLNYLFSRIVAAHMGEVSYGKIAMATGVLENVKQELYRRLAAPYEDEKIAQNGDIREYRKYPLEDSI